MALKTEIVKHRTNLRLSAHWINSAVHKNTITKQYKPQCIPQSHWNFRLIFYKNRLFSSKLYSSSASSTNTATVTKGNYGNQNWCVPRVCDLCIVLGQNQTPTYQLRCNWKKVIPCPSFYIYEWHKWHRWMGKVLIIIINILFANSIWCNYIFSFFHVS